MHSKKAGDRIEQELDLKPFMNLIVVLIPILLISAEFSKISIIDMKLPKQNPRGGNPNHPDKTPSDEDKSNKLILTAIVSDSAITLASKSSILPSIRYREYHHYVAKDDLTSFTKQYKPGEVVRHPKTGRLMKLSERNEIDLYAVDDDGNVINGIYNEFNELLINENGDIAKNADDGDTLFTLSVPSRLIIVQNSQNFKAKPLSAYDILKGRLINIKDRYKQAEDIDQIIIAAENNVLYDKIVKIMDIAKASEFPNIQISKLRES